MPQWKNVSRRVFCCLFLPAVLAVMVAIGRPAPAADSGRGRVILVSLDGFGYQTWSQDPVAGELTAVKEIARKGFVAGGVTPSFPSSTAVSHAALWTGVYGSGNGVTANSEPVLPRSEHTIVERTNGFRATSLWAEPIWVTAARQGKKAVAQQVTQGYPFLHVNTGGPVGHRPVVVNGYQTRMLSTHLALRAGDVQPVFGLKWNPPLPESQRPIRQFHWRAGGVNFNGALVAEDNGLRPLRYNTIYIATDPAGPRVRASLLPAENEAPRNRELARHFSEALYLPAVRDAGPVKVYFRLFEAADDGSDFLLYQTPMQELGYFKEDDAKGDARRRLIEEAGGFIGNGPSGLLEHGDLGKPVAEGGDGTAERRYLEGVELVARQMYRHAGWLWKNESPQLFISYLSLPDEADQAWLGMDRAGDAHAREFRTWAYVVINRFVSELSGLAAAGDSVLITSDHGMAPISSYVNIDALLREAGLQQLNPDGSIDLSRTQAVHVYNSVLINTADWKAGIVPRERADRVRKQVMDALGRAKDPKTGKKLITAFYLPEKDGDAFGIRCGNCGDVYFDLAPGYAVGNTSGGAVVEKLEVPRGYHGFVPTRAEMKANLIGYGPRLPQGVMWRPLRSIDVAPLVADLLGIAPPKDAKGISPLVAVR
jgi:hypothetical protein